MLLLLCVAALALASTVGPAVPYAPPIAPDPPAPPAPPAPLRIEMPQISAAQVRQLVQRHARLLALALAGAISLLTVASCVASTDACVRRRLNRNRRLPIAPPPDGTNE